MMTSDTPQAGQILAGKYRVDKIIGEGGMGYVLGAFHMELEEQVAIKWVRQVDVAGPQAIERFLREAKLCAKIQSEHVVRVRDVARTENGAPFIVMELLDGRDLASLVEGGKGIAPSLAVDYLIEACEAIAEAHQLGIVHRDLKLQNLFLARRKDGSDLVKVLDFGISKVTNSASFAMTAGTAILGSPLYMSPEQWRSSKDVDARSDIWSLGVVLFELLTGTVPFIAESLPELCMQIVSAPPRMPSAFVPSIPLELERVVLSCLAKDPAGRPSNIGAFTRALAPFATPRSRSSLERIDRIQPDGTIPAAPVSAPMLSEPGMSSIQTRTLVTEPHLRPPASAPVPSLGISETMPNWAASQPGSALPVSTQAPRPTPGKSKVGIALGGGLLVLAVGAFGVWKAIGARHDAPLATTSAHAPPESASAVALPALSVSTTALPSAAPIAEHHDEVVDAGAAAPSAKPTVVAKPHTAPKAPPASVSSYTPPSAPATATTRDLGGSRR